MFISDPSIISIVNPCKSSPCNNGGKCLVDNGQFKCECISPAFGLTCEHKINPCSHDSCLNGGTCVPTNNFTNYTCSCQKGFQGNRCQTESGKKFSIAEIL